MTTEQKIEKLGACYRAVCNCSDEFAALEGVPVSECEELLAFARAIASELDPVMQRVIGGLRGLLENAVHTVAGR